jgi:D-alanine-D-alanine ligase-like ATP-grasp enzyme
MMIHIISTSPVAQTKERLDSNINNLLEQAANNSLLQIFQTLPNAFELFGVDFLVDANGDVWLLELNAYPDFRDQYQQQVSYHQYQPRRPDQRTA